MATPFPKPLQIIPEIKILNTKYKYRTPQKLISIKAGIWASNLHTITKIHSSLAVDIDSYIQMFSLKQSQHTRKTIIYLEDYILIQQTRIRK